jgi:hypothetical protein
MGFFDFFKHKEPELLADMKAEIMRGIHRLDDRPTGWSIDATLSAGADMKRMRKEIGRKLTKEEIMDIFNRHIEYQATRPWVDMGRYPLGYRGRFSVFED